MRYGIKKEAAVKVKNGILRSFGHMVTLGVGKMTMRVYMSKVNGRRERGRSRVSRGAE